MPSNARIIAWKSVFAIRALGVHGLSSTRLGHTFANLPIIQGSKQIDQSVQRFSVLI